MPIKSVKMKISKNKKMRFFLMSQPSLNPKIRFLGQKMCALAWLHTHTHTHQSPLDIKFSNVLQHQIYNELMIMYHTPALKILFLPTSCNLISLELFMFSCIAMLLVLLEWVGREDYKYL